MRHAQSGFGIRSSEFGTRSGRARAAGLGLLGITLVLAAMAASAPAIQTQVVKTDTYDELAPGEFNAVTLSHLGRLTLAPELKRLYRPDAEILWSLAAAPDGRVFVGSGHAGKVFVIDRKSSGTLLVKFGAPEVTALLFHGGKLYAGTSPDGKLWVCDKPGTATLVYATGDKYVWDLAADAQGKLLVATGPKGKIFKVDPEKKKGELFFKSPDDNVLSLAFDPKGRLHAGTQGKGRVYRWNEDRPTSPVVIFEAPDDEVRRLAIDPSGNVFAAVNSELVARRLSSSLAQLVSSLAASAGSRSGEGGPGGEGPRPPSPPSGVGLPSGPQPTGRSEIFMIDPDGFARSLWRVSEAPVHGMAYDAGRSSLAIAAGNKGKLFRLDVRANYWVVLSVREEQILAVRSVGKQLLFATAGPTVAYSLGENLARKGEYLSSAVNAGSTVRWGALRRDGTDLERIEIETRSGNTKEPDATWYGWQPIKWNDGPKAGEIRSPVARYLQWRAKLTAGRNATSPELDLIEFFYAPSNEGPQIRRIDVKKAGTPGPGPMGPRPPESSGLPPSLAAAMAGAAGGAPPGGGPREPSGGREFNVADNSNSKKFDVTWLASDPNGDPLESAIYFKGEDEKSWKLLEEKLTQNKYTFDASSLADGVYRVKVVVSDKPANFAPAVKADELVSDQFVVDNTPPEIGKIKVTAARDAKGKWHVSASATDALSLIVSAKYNLDGGKWQVLVPTDGIFDDRSESFEFDTGELKGDEHVLGLIVTDREGNSAVGKAFLRP